MQGGRWHRRWLGLLLVALVSMAHGQGLPTVSLTSRQQLVEVGRPFEVELSVRHPEHMVVIFPDTAKDFKPYEVHTGLPIPTSTDEGVSEDVKIYKLYTWEIDSVQRLQFPVRFIDEKGDTAMLLSNPVDVEFQPMIPVYSDTMQLKQVATLADVREPINWVAWGIVFTAAALLIFVAGLVSFKPLKRMLKRMKIDREWRRHLGQLQALSKKVHDQPAYFSGLNQVWRAYLDRNRFLALSSMTTTELKAVVGDMPQLLESDRETLLQVSQSNDKVLYAGQSEAEDHAKGLWFKVHDIMQREYKRRKEALEL